MHVRVNAWNADAQRTELSEGQGLLQIEVAVEDIRKGNHDGCKEGMRDYTKE